MPGQSNINADVLCCTPDTNIIVLNVTIIKNKIFLNKKLQNDRAKQEEIPSTSAFT